MEFSKQVSSIDSSFQDILVKLKQYELFNVFYSLSRENYVLSSIKAKFQTSLSNANPYDKNTVGLNAFFTF